MKIYCNRLDKYDLHQYIGKDLWVRVRTRGLYSNSYIRVLDIDNSNNITFNLVFCSEINTKRVSLHSVYDILNKEYKHSIDLFHVCNPLDIITTQDILDSIDVEE